MESPAPTAPTKPNLPPTPPTPANNFNAPEPPPLEALPPHHKHRRLMIIIAAITMFTIAGIVLAVIWLFPSKPPVTSEGSNAAASTESEEDALARISQNALRKNDVSALLAGMANYATKNSGQLPDQIVTGEGDKIFTLCKGGCEPSTSLNVTFAHYDPNKMSFKPYAADLRAPDAETVYIVPSATCRDEATIVSGSDRQIAVLFALATSNVTVLEQRCSKN